MMKNKKIILLYCALLLIITILINSIYFWKHTEMWGQFVTSTSVIITLLLGLIAENRNITNIEIEQQKQRPLLHIDYTDREDEIRICMKNKGNGTLIISDYKLIHTQTKKEYDGIYNACVRIIHRNYNNYTGNLNNTVLSPSEEIELFHFKKSNEDNEQAYDDSKQLIRQSLYEFEIVVEYRDVYDNKMPVYKRSLEWFGRHE